MPWYLARRIPWEKRIEAVVVENVPEQIIPKSIATPSLPAYVFTAKLVDALPFYRQEKIFGRIGVDPKPHKHVHVGHESG